MAGATLGLAIAAAACSRNKNPAGSKDVVAAKSDPAMVIQPVTLSDAVTVSIQKVPIDLAAAKNEWTSFTLQINELPENVPLALRLRPLARAPGAGAGAAVPLLRCEAYQILPMPVDVNRAAYIRHTGAAGTADGRLPRALLPLKGAENGLIPLAGLRDPAHPASPASRASNATGPIHVWVDVQVPADAPAGAFQTACEIVPMPVRPDSQRKAGKTARGRRRAKRSGKVPAVELAAVASVAVNLHVYDFALPRERHLHLIAGVPWESLVRHYPADFEAVTAWKINRHDPRYAGTVKALDDLLRLAHQHRLTIVYPTLQPNVKWPPNIHNAPPMIDWDDFDSLVTPWFNGDFFADGTGVDYWPLPGPEYLSGYDLRSQIAYWSRAAAHFDQKDWIGKTSVSLQALHPGRLGPVDAIDLSNKAAELLAAHPRMRVTLPLEDDQVQLAEKPVQLGAPELPVGEGGPRMIDPSDTPRLLTAAPGLVFAPPLREWPAGVVVPEHWLRSDLPGLCPYFGAGGDEHDVRLWAWLAFLRQIRATDDGQAWHARRAYVQFASALPASADKAEAASPHELIWFYPGHWFGVDEPVPSMQLKWLRRAQQDYEYLWLAADRQERVHALWLARLITKPVEIQPNQVPDPAYTLMSGTADEAAWPKALNLLAKAILLHPPPDASGNTPPVNMARRDELDIETLQWVAPRERPMLLGRQAKWTWEIRPNLPGGNWLYLQVGLDLYNASDAQPENNQLRWLLEGTRRKSRGWEFKPHPQDVAPLQTYRVQREFIHARYNLEQMDARSRDPLEIEFKQGHTGATHVLKLSLPLAATEQMNRRFAFDGKLDDWTELDLIQDGPMVRMIDRPTLQRQATEQAATHSRIFTGWTDRDFVIGFGVEGVSAGQAQGRNFIDNYQAGRAWGEDLCEVLIQPVYANNSMGPLLHVVLKPNGSSWVERKLDPRQHANPWQPFESTGIRYVAAVAAGTAGGSGARGGRAADGKWTGELAIPWKVLNDPDHGPATLLRFNFSQHRTATGESASWAGPVDFGRDDAFTGCLQVRQPDSPGMGAAFLDSDQPR